MDRAPHSHNDFTKSMALEGSAAQMVSIVDVRMSAVAPIGRYDRQELWPFIVKKRLYVGRLRIRLNENVLTRFWIS